MSDTVISYPIPAYSNVPINPQFYQPRRYVISNITLGQTTLVETSSNMDYVVGQLVRLLVPVMYGSYQLNDVKAYVIQIVSPNQVLLNLDSSFFNPFIASPYTSTITAATKATQCVITTNNSFKPGDIVTIAAVEGMTQLNGPNRVIDACNATSITINLNSSSFSTYTTGGTISLQQSLISYPQIIAVGDINSGVVNSSGRTNNTTYVLGSFINISPQ